MTKSQERILKGFAICPGITIGKPFLFRHIEEKVYERQLPDGEIEKEVARYYTAHANSTKDIISLQRRVQREGSLEAASILSAHLEMIADPLMTTQIEEGIRKKKKNPEYVFKTVMGEYEDKFNRITDLFFKERLKDFHDVSKRIFAHLGNQTRNSLSQLAEKVVVFAHELSPSDTAEANEELIEGFVTCNGADTSHVAIVARAKGIPFVAHIDFPQDVAEGDWVIVDGIRGQVILHPTEETLENYKKELGKQKKKRIQDTDRLSEETKTLDGHALILRANIEGHKELDRMKGLKSSGHRGIGLFRTEYLFLAKDGFPSEDEQFEIYRRVVEKMGGEPTVIRTFDIGGDKIGLTHPTRYEKNPYLGCRAIRLMLREPHLFKAQIRAILRASAFGEVKILFPMISGIEELRGAKKAVEEAKALLVAEGIPFSRNLQIGCMIEVPSAALTSDVLANECDFFAIGTNDLIQYTLAVDRSDPTMGYLYSPYHPAIWKLISLVIAASQKKGIAVSVCGEMAANPKFVPLLLGMGIKEFSVTPRALEEIRNVVGRITLQESVLLAQKLQAAESIEEVKALVKTLENY